MSAFDRTSLIYANKKDLLLENLKYDEVQAEIFYPHDTNRTRSHIESWLCSIIVLKGRSYYERIGQCKTGVPQLEQFAYEYWLMRHRAMRLLRLFPCSLLST